jgi:hypothetical protein
MPLYRDVMIQADPTSRRVSAAVSALWSAPAWRATGNALAAAGVGLGLPDDQYELARLENPVPLLRRQHTQLIAALAGTIPAAAFRPGADSAALGHVVMSLCG